MRAVDSADDTCSLRRGPVQRAVYGTSRVLGEVEFLTARFGSHRFAPHTHPVFAVGRVERGACRVWHRGTCHLAGPGDLILFNPGDPHSAGPATNEPWDYSAVYFSPETAAQWLPARALRRGGLRLDGVVVREPSIARALSALCQSLERDPECAEAESVFARLLGSLFSRFRQTIAARAVLEDTERSEKVRQYIEANFSKPIRIRALADLAGENPFHLIREFSRVFGMPPYTYLLHVRVARARAMLKAGFPITETAMTVGFNDQSHLTRFFRRITGVPPGVFVKGVVGGSKVNRLRFESPDDIPVGRAQPMFRL